METKNKTINDREIRYGVWNVSKRSEDETEGKEEKDDGYYHLEGKAVCFDDPTVLYTKEQTGNDFDISEVMEKDCFNEADISDVVLNVNHGEGNFGVARTRNKTLALDIRDDGVYINAKLKKDNPRCEQFYRDVSDGLLDRMSFAFTIDDEEYEEETHTYHVRKVGKVFDVSAVEFPAYGNTSISATRSADLEKLADELESRHRLAEVAEKRKEVMDLIEMGLASAGEPKEDGNGGSPKGD